jgi:hypothetical protein
MRNRLKLLFLPSEKNLRSRQNASLSQQDILTQLTQAWREAIFRPAKQGNQEGEGITNSAIFLAV